MASAGLCALMTKLVAFTTVPLDNSPSAVLLLISSRLRTTWAAVVIAVVLTVTVPLESVADPDVALLPSLMRIPLPAVPRVKFPVIVVGFMSDTIPPDPGVRIVSWLIGEVSERSPPLFAAIVFPTPITSPEVDHQATFSDLTIISIKSEASM